MKELSCDYFCITAGHFKLLFSQFYEFGYSSSITLEVMMEGIEFCGRNPTAHAFSFGVGQLEKCSPRLIH